MTNKPAPKKGAFLQKLLLSVVDQLDDVKTSTDESRGVATVSGKKDGKHFSVTFEESDLGQTRTFTQYYDLPRNRITKMKLSGFTKRD